MLILERLMVMFVRSTPDFSGEGAEALMLSHGGAARGLLSGTAPQATGTFRAAKGKTTPQKNELVGTQGYEISRET